MKHIAAYTDKTIGYMTILLMVSGLGAVALHQGMTQLQFLYYVSAFGLAMYALAGIRLVEILKLLAEAPEAAEAPKGAQAVDLPEGLPLSPATRQELEELIALGAQAKAAQAHAQAREASPYNDWEPRPEDYPATTRAGSDDPYADDMLWAHDALDLDIGKPVAPEAESMWDALAPEECKAKADADADLGAPKPSPYPDGYRLGCTCDNCRKLRDMEAEGWTLPTGNQIGAIPPKGNKQ